MCEVRDLISASLDDAGLSIEAFRLYCHYVRRCGNKPGATCWDGRKAACRICNINTHAIQRAREELIARNMIKVISGGSRKAYVIALTSVETWVAEDDNLVLNRHQKNSKDLVLNRHQAGAESTPDLVLNQHSKVIHKGNPLEGNPTTSENVDDVNHDEEALIDFWEEREAPLSESCDITTQSEPYDITVEKLSEANSLSDLSGANLLTPKAPAPPPAGGLTWAEAVAIKSAQRKAAKSAKSAQSNTAELERLAQMLQDRWPAQALQAGMPAIRPAVRRAWTQSRLALSAFAHDLPERLTAALAAWATWTDAQIPSQVDWLANGKWANPIKSFKSTTTTTSSASEARLY